MASPGRRLPLRLLLLLLLPSFLGSLPHGALALSRICFEKISKTGAIYMQEHPAGGKVAVGMQTGQIYLYSLPPLGSSQAMAKISLYLDLSRLVIYDVYERGLFSFAFHPNFLSNGKFYVFYACDALLRPECKAPCGCTKFGCNSIGCLSTTVISEYQASNPATDNSLKPKETRKILTFGRPFANHNGGHMFFGKDGYLYISSGDGGAQFDIFNLSQDVSNYFGKILRIDVDHTTGSSNFTVPSDNPFQGPGQNRLVYALGLRNPWRCDQDPITGVIVCGDVGQARVEEVDVIVSGGNYEWRNYEGSLYNYGGRNESGFVGTVTKPIFEYDHDGTRDCIIGGVFFTNSNVNSCLYGKYLYADNDDPFWVASIAGATTQLVNTSCVANSPFSCRLSKKGVAFSSLYSFARDLSGNAYVLSGSGIYRVANQSLCGISC